MSENTTNYLRRYRLFSKQSKGSYEMAVAVAKYYGVGCFHDGSTIWLVHSDNSLVKECKRTIKRLRNECRSQATSHSMFSGLCQGVAAHYHSVTLTGLSDDILDYLARRQNRVTQSRASQYNPVEFCAGLQAALSLVA